MTETIAMVATRMSPDIGGIATHVSEIAPRLAKQGYDLQLLTTDRTASLPTSETVDGVPVLRFRAYPGKRDYYLSPGLLLHLLRKRYALVHMQGANNTVPFYVLLAAIVTRTPFVITFHSGGPTSNLRRRLRKLQFRLLGLLARHARILVGVSEFEAAVMADATGKSRDEITVIRNGGLEEAAGAAAGDAGQWPLDWTPPPDADLVVSIGRLERYKGHHRAVAAMPGLLETLPNATLLILGTGAEREALLAQARQLGVADKVHVDFVPPARRDGLFTVLSRARIVLLLSDYEAHPVAVMEAAAAGTRSLVCLNSGMSELVDLGWANGITADSPPAAFAAAIADTIERGALADPADLPTWDACADEVAALYRDLGLQTSTARTDSGQGDGR